MLEKQRPKSYRSELFALIQSSDRKVNAAAIMTSDGLMIDSVLADRMDADRIAAMAASLLALAERAIDQVGRGNLVQLLIEGSKGAMLLVQAGPDRVLAVSTEPEAKIGRVFLDAKRCADRIAERQLQT